MLRKTLVTFLLIFVLAIVSCDSESGASLPILVITQNWSVDGYPNRFFNFNSDDDGQTAGTFTGEENNDFDFYDLSGSWSDGEITFTVDDDPPRTYMASFEADSPNVLFFEGAGEELTLRLGE